jgi:4'-phosphopantetheinyl transferase
MFQRLHAWPQGEVWHCVLDEESFGESDTSSLSGAEKVRAARFMFERDRRRFVNSHGALRALLGERVGQPGRAAVPLQPQPQR